MVGACGPSDLERNVLSSGGGAQVVLCDCQCPPTPTCVGDPQCCSVHIDRRNRPLLARCELAVPEQTRVVVSVSAHTRALAICLPP